MRSFFLFATLLILFLPPYAASSQVRLPQIIRDSMILQRDEKVNIWGWAAVNEKVSVRFKGKNYNTRTATNGKWSVSLPPTAAGGPYSIEIKASNTIRLKDVLFGDVFFCSGQSNMVHQLNIHDVTYATDIAEANYPAIRHFLIPTTSNLLAPQDDITITANANIGWKWAGPGNIRPFSAVAYFFARKLYDKYHVPIGLINASVGGTPVEAWTSEAGLKDFSTVMASIQKNKDTAYVGKVNRDAAAAMRRPPSTDLGSNAAEKWFDVSYTPNSWRPINIPGFWEDQGLKDLNGVVWYRKEIDVPPAMTGKSARIFLGRIVDADILYINGKQVGNTTYMYPQRRYHIAADVLKPGKNIFVIRVTNNYGKGGFVPDKPYCLFAGTDTIDLKGTWHYKVGEVFEPVNYSSLPQTINVLNQPSALFNAMVAPVINYTIKGILWYQGESNAGQPAEYAKLLPALINDWRQQWKQPTLPFLYVQLPGFMEMNYLPAESNWAILRESQLKTLSVPNTAMAVAIDLGEWNDIHPDNKKDVGLRLAQAAQKLIYKEDIVPTGPIYRSFEKQGNKIIIEFDHTGSGLVTNDGEAPAEFAIAGDDKKFIWAKSKIENNKVIVWSDAIADPQFVRYAWADNPVNPNLYNKEGLPASPFRIGE